MPKPPIAETNKRYVVCVGINRYHASAQASDLQCAEHDAQAMYNLFLRKGFAQDHCRLLIGENATREAIHEALTTFVLTKPKSDDLVMFYFAGHGVPIGIPHDEDEEDAEMLSDVFLVTYDFDYHKMTDERGAWLHYPLRLENLRRNYFESTRSKKVLFLLDSCHSGDFFGSCYRGEQAAQYYIDQAFARKSSGRVA